MVDLTDTLRLFFRPVLSQWRLPKRPNGAKRTTWEGARVLLVEVPLEAAAVGRLLPSGMRLSEPATGSLFVAHYPKTSFDVSYREAALLINVRTPWGDGVHCPWMLVDDDTALIYGREGLGYPKKLGRFSFVEAPSGDISASVERRGITVLSIRASHRRAQPGPLGVVSRKVFNVGGLGQMLAVNPIWMFKPRQHLREAYQVDLDLHIEPSPYDPIASLVKLDKGLPQRGHFVVMDIVGSPFLIPVGVTGPRYFANTSTIRFK